MVTDMTNETATRTINVTLTSEIEAYDPYNSLESEQDRFNYMERYRAAVTNRLREEYQDAEVAVEFGFASRVRVSGFNDEDEETRYIDHLVNDMFGNQEF